MTDSFDPQPKISLEPFLLKEEDVAKFINTDFDLQKDIIDQACKKVAMLNEKTAEQALILKLNNRIAEQQRVIDRMKSGIRKAIEDNGSVPFFGLELYEELEQLLGENNDK